MGAHDPSPGWTLAAGWMDAALGASSDLVVVIDTGGAIAWCSPSSVSLLGIRPEQALGRSLAEFLHPDDLERAVEVIALVADGAFDASPITPALYRVGTEATGWAQMEINASEGPDGGLLVVGRPGGDLVITDQLLEAVTGGEPFVRQAALVLELGRWRYPVDGYVLRYHDEEGVEQRITAGAPAPDPSDALGVDGTTPWEAARRDGREVSVPDLRAVGPDHPLIGEARARDAIEAGFLGCLAAPVPDPSHPAGAVLTVWTSADGPTTAGHRYAMGTMRRALALVLQQRAQLHQLERASRIDPLTGAMSRVRFLEVLDASARADGPDRALLYVDLDGFKLVNDSLGHGAGDEVLRVAVERLTAVVPADAVVARLGGDEFVVLCDAGADLAADVAGRIVATMRAPIALRDAEVVVGASVGVALGPVGDDPHRILDAADAALLTAKADGKGRWRVATPDPSR